MIKRLILAVAVLLFPVLPAQASPSSDGFVTGTNAAFIDWTRGEIVVTGTAGIPEVIRDPDDYRYDAKDYSQPRTAAQARLFAKTMAVENALQTATALIRNIRVTDKTVLADHMKNGTVNNKVNSLIKNNYRMKALWSDPLQYSVVLTWPLYGDKGLLALNGEPDVKDNFINFDYEVLTNSPGKTNRKAFGGLVISAPYLKVAPALAPRIVSESGFLVYDSSVVLAKDAMKNGMVLYAVTPLDMPDSLASGLYHCTALNTTSFEGPDLVLSDDDAAAILGNPLTIEALRHCRVVILASEKQ